MKNKPKIMGKYFLKRLEDIQHILLRKTGNEMNYTESEICDIVQEIMWHAYTIKQEPKEGF